MKTCEHCNAFLHCSGINNCPKCHQSLIYKEDEYTFDNGNYELICVCGDKPQYSDGGYICSCGRRYDDKGWLVSSPNSKSYFVSDKLYCYGENRFTCALYLRCICGNEFKFLSTHKHIINPNNNDYFFTENCPSCNSCGRIYRNITFTDPESYKEASLPQLIICPICEGKVSSQAKSCPHCGQPINTTITCPICGGQEIDVIDGLTKGISALAFGAFASNTILNNYQCKKCKHKFK